MLMPSTPANRHRRIRALTELLLFSHENSIHRRANRRSGVAITATSQRAPTDPSSFVATLLRLPSIVGVRPDRLLLFD
jgi:hypothetical protein